MTTGTVGATAWIHVNAQQFCPLLLLHNQHNVNTMEKENNVWILLEKLLWPHRLPVRVSGTISALPTALLELLLDDTEQPRSALLSIPETAMQVGLISDVPDLEQIRDSLPKHHLDFYFKIQIKHEYHFPQPATGNLSSLKSQDIVLNSFQVVLVTFYLTF